MEINKSSWQDAELCGCQKILLFFLKPPAFHDQKLTLWLLCTELTTSTRVHKESQPFYTTRVAAPVISSDITLEKKKLTAVDQHFLCPHKQQVRSFSFSACSLNPSSSASQPPILLEQKSCHVEDFGAITSCFQSTGGDEFVLDMTPANKAFNTD